MNAAAMSGKKSLLLSAGSEWHVILRAVTRIHVDAAHGVEHEHGDFGSCRIARKRDARDSRSNRRAANVPRSSFVQGLRDHVIVTSLTGAILGMPLLELRVD